jgi:hypothetical protein
MKARSNNNSVEIEGTISLKPYSLAFMAFIYLMAGLQFIFMPFPTPHFLYLFLIGAGGSSVFYFSYQYRNFKKRIKLLLEEIGTQEASVMATLTA